MKNLFIFILKIKERRGALLHPGIVSFFVGVVSLAAIFARLIILYSHKNCGFIPPRILTITEHTQEITGTVSLVIVADHPPTNPTHPHNFHWTQVFEVWELALEDVP